jgi:hypothetical protein
LLLWVSLLKKCQNTAQTSYSLHSQLCFPFCIRLNVFFRPDSLRECSFDVFSSVYFLSASKNASEWTGSSLLSRKSQ